MQTKVKNFLVLKSVMASLYKPIANYNLLSSDRVSREISRTKELSNKRALAGFKHDSVDADYPIVTFLFFRQCSTNIAQ